MTTLLKVDEIDTVGFVDAGANQLAEVLIWKRAEAPAVLKQEVDMSDATERSGGKLATMFRAVGLLLNWSDEDVEAVVEEAAIIKAAEEAEMSDVFNVADLPEPAQEAFRALESRATEAETKLAAAQAELADVVKADEPEDVMKGLPEEVSKRIDLLEKRATEAEEIAKAERTARQRAEFAKQAEEQLDQLAGEPEDKVDVLAAIYALPDDQRDKVLEMLRGANEVAKTGKVYDEHGRGGGDETTTAVDKIAAKARALIEKGDFSGSFEQAFDHVLKTDRDLAGEYVAERRHQ